MAGGPSQLETFDYKPELEQARRPAVPRIVHQGPATRAASEHGAQSPRAVRRIPRSTASRGRRFPSLFPHIAGIADDICIIRSMVTEQINHDPAHAFMNSGSILKGRPSMGSWLLYGLGAETETCPASSSSPRQASPAAAAGLGPAMVSGLPASQVPGHPVPVEGRRGALRRQSRRRLPDHASGRLSTRSSGSTACWPRSALDPEIAHAHRPVRDGLPDADVACRS